MFINILAEAAAANAFDVSSITQVISAIGSMGFAIWFAHHTTTVTLPKQQQEHREALRDQDKTHAETIKELVTEMRASREAYDRWRMSGGKA